MSEFTEKLNSSELVSNAWDEIDKGQADAGLLFDTISNEFKDWQPPKPLVVVPQIVADWFEDRMVASFLSVVLAYSFSVDEDEDIKWIRDNGGIDLLCKMKLYGYTVEKEQLYEVVINGLYLAKLMKCDDSKSHSFIEKDELVNWQETGYRLTAKQIKMIDERYLKFAVKVDEV